MMHTWLAFSNSNLMHTIRTALDSFLQLLGSNPLTDTKVFTALIVPLLDNMPIMNLGFYANISLLDNVALIASLLIPLSRCTSSLEVELKPS